MAARSEGAFNAYLREQDVSEGASGDGVRLLAALSLLPGQSEPDNAARTVLSEIALRAYNEVLFSRVRDAANTLWGIDTPSVQVALKQHSTDRGYSELVRDWFARFLGRTLQYFIDRELPNHVGEGAVSTSGEAVTFERDVLAYATERVRILRDYAPGWLDKTLWQQKQLTDDTAKRFFAYCITKILQELGQEKMQ